MVSIRNAPPPLPRGSSVAGNRILQTETIKGHPRAGGLAASSRAPAIRAERTGRRERRNVNPSPNAPAGGLIEADGYSKVGPGPMAALRFKLDGCAEEDGRTMSTRPSAKEHPARSMARWTEEAAIQNSVDDREERRATALRAFEAARCPAAPPPPMWSARTSARGRSARPEPGHAGLGGPRKSFFAEIDAGVAQDVVGRCDMKEELRNAEGQDQRLAR